MPESIGFTPEQGKALETFYQTAQTQPNLEFEIRYGKFKAVGEPRNAKQVFVPGVTIDTFQRVQGYLGQYVAPKTEISVDSIYMLSGKRIRKTEILNEKGKIKETMWMAKSVLTKIDLYSFQSRISIAREEAISPQISNIEPSFMRKKQRISYTIKNFRYDLTTSLSGETPEDISGTGKTPVDYTYEIEVEYIGGAKDYLEFYDQLLESANRVIRIIQNSYFITSTEEAVSVKKRYQKLLSKRESSFFRLVGNQPLTFHREHLDIVSQGYSVTDKTDGDRAQLFIVETGRVYIIMSSGDVMSTGLLNEENKNTILDGEFLHYTKLLQKDPTNLFMAFDILIHKGKSLVSDPGYLLENRHVIVNEVSKSFKHININVPHPGRYTRVQLKKFLVSQNIFKDAGTILKYFDQKDKKPYNIDGLIFTPVNVPYLLNVSKKNEITYKWKPPHESTIDMYGVIVGPARKNPEFNVWHLWIGSKTQERFVMPDQSQFPLEFIPTTNRMEVNGQTYTLFQPMDKPNAFETYIHSSQPFYSNTVIEFRFDLELRYFVPSRTRWDKVYSQKGPNFIVSAMDVWKSINEPVTREMLVSYGTPALREQTPASVSLPLPGQKRRKDSEVYNMRLFHNSIKQSQLTRFIKQVRESPSDTVYILDLASGKGGDLQKYPKGAYVVGFDINKESVEEARRRAEALLASKRISGEFHYFHLDVSQTNVHSFIRSETDLPDPAMQPFDLVNCQFAMHFFFRTEQTLRTFFTNVTQHLKDGGYFIGTAFDGRKVFEALRENGGTVSNDTFTIKQRYRHSPKDPFDSLDMYGQEIEVYLGGDTVMSEVTLEYLVNFEKLERYAKEYGLEMEEIKDFEKMYTGDKKTKFPMTNDEKAYSFLNVAFAFRYTGNNRRGSDGGAVAVAGDNELLGTVDDIMESIRKMNITGTLEDVELEEESGNDTAGAESTTESEQETESETESESGDDEEGGGDDDDQEEETRPPVQAKESGGGVLSKEEFERRLQRKPCGPEGPRLTRAEVVEMARFLNLKGISKKNMNDLCQEIKLNK